MAADNLRIVDHKVGGVEIKFKLLLIIIRGVLKNIYLKGRIVVWI